MVVQDEEVLRKLKVDDTELVGDLRYEDLSLYEKKSVLVSVSLWGLFMKRLLTRGYALDQSRTGPDEFIRDRRLGAVSGSYAHGEPYLSIQACSSLSIAVVYLLLMRVGPFVVFLMIFKP